MHPSFLIEARREGPIPGAQGHTELTSHKFELISRQRSWLPLGYGALEGTGFEKYASPQLAETFSVSTCFYSREEGKVPAYIP